MITEEQILAEYTRYRVSEYHPMWNIVMQIAKTTELNVKQRIFRCQFGEFLIQLDSITENQQSIDVWRKKMVENTENSLVKD